MNPLAGSRPAARPRAIAIVAHVAIVCVATALILTRSVAAQGHVHGADEMTRPPDARLDLLLGGPHLVLYHRGYLALTDEQVASLQRLRRGVCDAEATFVQRSAEWRDRLAGVLADSVPRPREALEALAAAEADWLTELVRARRETLAQLTPSQRTEASALREHWAREAMAMIEEATRPGQRGHPGMQIPIRVPGMVVAATTLLPFCESLHGPASHIAIPPP